MMELWNLLRKDQICHVDRDLLSNTSYGPTQEASHNRSFSRFKVPY